MRKSVIGIVDSQRQAEQVVRDLEQVGIQGPDVSVLSSSLDATHDFAFARATKAPEGAISGVGAGGVLCGTLGFLAGIGTLAIPGLGPLIAAGPLLAALSGAAVGAAIGGIVGALVGMGIPELEAKCCERRPDHSNILVAVHVDTRKAAHDAAAVLRRDGARDVVSARDARAAA